MMTGKNYTKVIHAMARPNSKHEINDTLSRLPSAFILQTRTVYRDRRKGARGFVDFVPIAV